jgi:hypothetical protein
VTRMRKWRVAVALVGLLGTSLIGTSVAGANVPATPDEAATGTVVAPSGTTNAGTAVERGPNAAAAATPSPRRGDDLINLPAEPLDTYKTKKTAATGNKANAQGPAKPEVRQGVLPLGEPSTVTKNFKGVDFAGAGSAFPPDTHGAVGAIDYLQIVNTRLRAYRTSDNVLVRDQNLAAFFGDTDFVFDPRALYDNTWSRYVVLATRKADSPTDSQRYYWLGVSTSPLATSSFRIYKVSFGLNPGDWCDFPQLGMDQDAVIVTCNMFHVNDAAGNSNFTTTYVTSIAKARIYNGWGFSVPNFLPGSFSIAPPLVTGRPLQQSNRSFLISADAAADRIHLYRMENTAHPPETSLVLQANVPVTAWDIPPLAFNGGGPLLDTLDGRFQNNSVQNGTSLWNVHTEGIVRNGVAYNRPRFYEINTTTNAVAREGLFFLDFTSDDWNASVGVNASQEAFFTFSSARSNLFPQIRTQGCQVAVDGCSGDIGAGTLIVSSTSYSQHIDSSGRNRYGDYTSVSLDPTGITGCAAHRRAWITNQYTDSTDHLWDTRLARIGFC